MIRNRQFMTGLGIGLIVGALLLQIMMIGQGPNGKLQTKEQIEQAAAALNLKVVSADQELLTEEEWQEKAEQEQAGLDEGIESEDPLDPSNPDAPNTPGAPDDPDLPGGKGAVSVPETTSPASPKEPDKATVTYKISHGSTLTGVAEGLLKAGVISDKEAFLQAAKDKKINYKVRTGTFTFEQGEDFSSIISKISSTVK
ncbi:hypothetical protein NYE70_02865 [Paenibacillus sp. FSL R5-0407]|uniref:hypothetical protein n=1 Tax=Paenibacillus sp. FSL R5-0407 TaxID=2975320 RepID=UPI0030F9DCC1